MSTFHNKLDMHTMADMDLFNLGGRVALITGSSRGLGLTVARGLGRAGATVALNARDKDRLGRAVRELEGLGIRTAGFAFDVTRGDEVAAGVKRIESELGPIGILVNNAGVNLRGKAEEIPEKTWHDVLATNLTSAWLVSQKVGQGMVRRGAGKIINICSLMSELGRAGTAPYTASKGGLKMLTRALATEWARHNVQVNGIGPGYFITEMTQPLADDPKFDAWIKARTPAARWGDPQELVGTAVYLASEASSFVNGQIIYVDGGVLASL